MLLKRSPDFKYSDITPRDIYLNRRKFLYGMGLAGGVALAGRSLANLAFPSARAYASTKLDVVKGQFNSTEKVTPEQVVTTYNLLRVRHRQGRSIKECGQICDLAMVGFSRGRSRQAAEIHDGRNPEACAARGANLQAPLRRGLVNHRAVGWLFVQHSGEAGRAEFECEIRRVRILF